MEIYQEIVNLGQEAREDVVPEHVDRLILISWDIVRVMKPPVEFVTELQMLEDYFEQWGVCSRRFWSMYERCVKIFSSV